MLLEIRTNMKNSEILAAKMKLIFNFSSEIKVIKGKTFSIIIIYYYNSLIIIKNFKQYLKTTNWNCFKMLRVKDVHVWETESKHSSLCKMI